MEENDIPYELIDKYLSGKLGEEEARAFERQVEGDAELRREFQAHVKAEVGVRQALREARREEFNREFDQLYPKGAKVRNFRPFGWVAVAAAIAFLIILTYSLVNAPVPLTNQALYAQNFEQPDITWGAGQRGAEAPTNPDKLWALAQDAYQEGNYEEAARQLKALIQDSSHQSHPKAWFTLGLMQLRQAEQMENPAAMVKEAQASLDAVSPGSIYFQDARWYKALSYLLIDDIQGCKAMLEELAVAPNSTKKEDAKELLKTLEKRKNDS